MSVDKKDIDKKVTKAKRVAARRTRKGGKMRKAGKHWYELEAYFDDAKKEVIGVNESGFMMGVLEDFVVVEIPDDKNVAEINALGMRLADMGIKALIVKSGIRFLRLREISGEQETKLNEILAHQEAAECRQRAVDEMMEGWEERNAEAIAKDRDSTNGPKAGDSDA